MTSTLTPLTAGATTPAPYRVADWAQWHADRERDLAAPHGWLSLTAFHWLTEEPTALPGLPGRWAADDSGPTSAAVVTADAADGLTVLEADDQPPATVGSRVATVAEGGSVRWVGTADGRVVELIRRGGRSALRVRDPHAPARTGFAGVPTFPLDPAWVLPARVRPLPTARDVEVATARPELSQTVRVVAEVVVGLPGGEQATLLATAAGEGRLAITFHDATNGDSTARWRTVTVPAPDADGWTAVDLNRAVNPPFAFSDHGTCPAPPQSNIIGVAVTAGERRPATVGADAA